MFIYYNVNVAHPYLFYFIAQLLFMFGVTNPQLLRHKFNAPEYHIAESELF